MEQWIKILNSSISINMPITKHVAIQLSKSGKKVTREDIKSMHENLMSDLACYTLPTDSIRPKMEDISSSVRDIIRFKEEPDILSGVTISQRSVSIVTLSKQVAFELLMFLAINTSYTIPQMLHTALHNKVTVNN